MAKKLRVGILFGGRSGEHEVSLLSAASILKAIDRKKFEVVPIGISKTGRWLTEGNAAALLEGAAIEVLPADAAEAAGPSDAVAALVPDAASLGTGRLDVVFPVLHGTFGEDGTIQGLFELADIAYVGSGVLGSSAGMDKDVMKRLFSQAKLPIVKHVTVLRSEWEKSPRKTVTFIESALKYPLFVKPANLGSSVGISKAHDRKELGPALKLAARFDRKIVIEQGVTGSGKSRTTSKARELEVAVLGNDDPKASVVGEIIPDKEFYDYEAKYLSDGSVPVIPAKLTAAESKQIRAMAVEAFRACDLAGLARVDFLMEPDGKRRIYLNEVNTLPGFTAISMYPKLWQATGLGYSDLITTLIELALERHNERSRTSFTFEASK
ncbi:D-alanine--D-alanine ligase family protein [Acidicapsa ligni]|uniref:D-alanine--D-alanine ligase family protein n=1 Tax=Acidicapsa ligni TaxID=542300 RepID=UPI0021E0537C|nr:D-alanine--D-alanine ligase family protein [Acidicapsa ligni]